MPFNVWCLGCERHIARGVRFNAEKKQIGKYYSSPIYSFRMKCPSCAKWIEIHTDPKQGEYLCVDGAKRKTETWSAEELGLPPEETEEELERRTSNPFARLEHEVKDHRKAEAIRPHLESLKKAKDAAYADDWASSQRLRKRFRSEKAAHLEAVAVADDIRRRGGFDLKLLPEHPADIKAAQSVDFIWTRSVAKREELLSLPSLKTDPKLQNSLAKSIRKR